jgi:hypothetical protein
MNSFPSVDDAAVERRLRFHQNINRASLVISGVIAADVAALYLGLLPNSLRAFVRPVLVFGVTGLFALEAWRHLGQGQQSGRLRWARLTIGACMGALAIGEALRHIWPSVDPTPQRALGVAVTALAIALVCDLREFPDRSHYGALARVGMAVGALGTAVMGVTLLGETIIPRPFWWRLFLGSTILIAVAGGIYLRVRSVVRTAPSP